jgi:hypothetical protein
MAIAAHLHELILQRSVVAFFEVPNLCVDILLPASLRSIRAADSAISSSSSLISTANLVFEGLFRYSAKSMSRLLFSPSRLAFSTIVGSNMRHL